MSHCLINDLVDLEASGSGTTPRMSIGCTSTLGPLQQGRAINACCCLEADKRLFSTELCNCPSYLHSFPLRQSQSPKTAQSLRH